MRKEAEFTQIKEYIDEIITISENKELSFNEKQQLKRAASVYEDLYRDAERGRIDPDVLHENITSFLYMLQ